MTPVPFTFDFETCDTCGDEWTPIGTDELRRKLSDQEISLILEQKAVVRKDMAKYRRYIPAEVIDWYKVLPQ